MISLAINQANTGFMLLAASLVMLMTPGLAFFYGGLVGRSNTLTIMIQSFASMGITTVMWWLVGYSLCFSGGADGIYGNFHLAFLRGVTPASMYTPSHIPLVVLIAYQMMFAIITPALITGAFTNRVTFKAYLIFLVVWQLFVYYPFVHMIWGNGLLAQWGVRDFAGGIVVHASAGWAALASVLYIGKRRYVDTPHNIPFIALGTGLLWFGWYGFNAGSELKVDDITSQAFLNTDLAASFAATTWLFVEWGARPQAALRRAPDRGRRRACDHHAGGRVHPDLRRGDHRHRLRRRLLLRGRSSRTACAGTTRSTSGACTGWAAPSASSCSACSPARASTRAGGVGLIHGSGSFFGKQVAAGVGCSLYAFAVHLDHAQGDRQDHARARGRGCRGRPGRGDARGDAPTRTGRWRRLRPRRRCRRFAVSLSL